MTNLWNKLVVPTIFLLFAVAAHAEDLDPTSSPPPLKSPNRATIVDRSDISSLFTSNITARIPLIDGHTVPVVGLGVALTADETYNAVKWALDVGYRLIDTAAEESYGNEDQVGDAIRDAKHLGINRRNEIYVTTKLWDSDHGFWQTVDAFYESYETVNLGTIDLYLIHSPFGGRIIETWDAMLYLQSRGYIQSIGVSNFGVQHLQAIKDSGRPLPAVNQIEMHPLVYQQRQDLIQWCHKNNVQIQAYGSLLHGYRELQSSPILIEMQSKNYPHKSISHILLRWAIQHNFLIIPKSSKKYRIEENVKLYDFELFKEDMQILDSWGERLSEEERNIYKEDWNWNPIDEAPVHLGRTFYWPNYRGVDEYFEMEDEDRDRSKDEL